MNKLLWLALLLITLSSCSDPKQDNFTITALPVNAELKDNILEGPSVLNDPDRFIWGASVIKGDDGRYHMLYSTWECGDSIPPFSDSWVLYSKIAYAISDYPDRDFKFQKIVLQGRAAEGDSSAWDAQMAHNPHLQKFNGKYYLYYVGGKDPGLQAPVSPGEHVNLRNRVQQSQCIGVIEFASFDDLLNGNFTRSDKPLISPRTRVKPDNIVNPSPEGTEAKPDNIIAVNPSVVQRPSDGKYLLYFKGNLYEPHWKGVHGVAISDSPTGPFTATDAFVFDVRNDDGTLANGEDPFVWYHGQNKKFYSVLKDFTGRITSGKPGLAILESEDGIDWTKPEHSFFMKKQVILAGGDTLKVSNLERPQLLIDESGYPLVLYAACSVDAVGQKTDGSTFNIHIPLRSE
ncbi:glycoside hydrolase family protein [Maribellus sp. CM-23]|uniref:glycoside hydrolase family protein n=1 Tax=Maribellus sp. CM-23 TaxID=2781026 RepID=UPI001F45EB53|nr:glycoside hydrolase family protein [Maribellus sp. CM-23]MCE4566360.1 glycoside hydrolase family protein [Maribellus sp. CM-23]